MIFSIITATYNAEELIESTIKSVLQQNEREILCEHVIVDGASTDGTVEIVKRYADEYPDMVRYISEPDENLYDALNKGIKMARGSYINVHGAGDCLKENILQRILPYTNDGIDLLYGQIYDMGKKYIEGKQCDKYSILRENMPHQAMFYHKRIFERLGGFDLKYRVLSDYAFNIKVIGEDDFTKKYLDFVMSDYLNGGVSALCKDSAFAMDEGILVREYLGEDIYHYFKESGLAANKFEHMYEDKVIYDEEGNVVNTGDKYPKKFPVYKEFDDYLLNCVNEKVFIFGAGQGGVNLGKYIKDINKTIQIMGYLDNGSGKWNTEVDGYTIYNPDYVLGQELDKVIIASDWRNEIKQQLLEMGINEEKILIAY